MNGQLGKMILYTDALYYVYDTAEELEATMQKYSLSEVGLKSKVSTTFGEFSFKQLHTWVELISDVKKCRETVQAGNKLNFGLTQIAIQCFHETKN